ncbi:geranylgeranyl reductase family protein [Kitasatospora sp. NBC_01287]|uniref:geranylgeranyl reductase family protein n=1 Tax=Kitasatospora sp. NBC_01287 TaxID=2903573 RepID=UPI00224D53AF|nr:geranylgeranyl reductase family protein [Kitasatospora sp. NBC_01287]MCX4750686.1 geranylgeranyl reductase family protein [Kitasatospora sp. NBC_01287]
MTDGPDPLDGVWDVVVVGAGPAGSSAAHAAAAQGRRVLLLDKAEHPRYKTCGGGIIGPSRDSLPPDFKLPLQDRVHAVTFALNGRFTRTRRSKRMLFGLVNRDEFDLRLVEAAQQAGAVLVCGVTVTGVEQQGGADRRTVAVTLADGRSVQARAVVGADGSASRIGRHVGVTFDQIDLGLEAEIPVPEQVARAWEGRIHLDWGPLPGSYGWVFPKTDSGTLTVGVISARGDGELTKRYLADYIRRLGLSGFTPAVESGHLTRCRAEDSPLSRGRVLVAGDAAGLLEPWTREGISYALRSGRLAGEWAVQVAEATGPQEVRRQALNYAFAVKAGLGVEMRAGKVMLEAFERRPHLFHLAVCLIDPAWRAFARTTQGHSTFAQILRQYGAARRLAALASR